MRSARRSLQAPGDGGAGDASAAPLAAARGGARKRRRSCSADVLLSTRTRSRDGAGDCTAAERPSAGPLREAGGGRGPGDGNPPDDRARAEPPLHDGEETPPPPPPVRARARGDAEGVARSRCREYVSRVMARGIDCLRSAELSTHEILDPAASAGRGYSVDWSQLRAVLAVLAADMSRVYGDIAHYFSTGTPRHVLELVLATAMSAGRSRPVDERSALVTAAAARTLAAFAEQLGLRSSHVVVTETDPALAATAAALRSALRSAHVALPDVRTFCTRHAEIALLYTERACRALGVETRTDADAGEGTEGDGRRARGVVVYQVAPWLENYPRMPAPPKLLWQVSATAAAEMAAQKCRAWAEVIVTRQDARRGHGHGHGQARRPQQHCLAEGMLPPDAERAMEVALCGVVVALLRGTRIDSARDSFNHLAPIMPQVRERQLLQELVSAARARLVSSS